MELRTSAGTTNKKEKKAAKMSLEHVLRWRGSVLPTGKRRGLEFKLVLLLLLLWLVAAIKQLSEVRRGFRGGGGEKAVRYYGHNSTLSRGNILAQVFTVLMERVVKCLRE